MEDIIYLVHRIPYPPDKGDKIRSFHVLRYLSRYFNVHLGCFVDARADVQHLNKVTKYCKSVCVRPLDPAHAKLRCLKGLVTGRPLTVPYYFDNRLQHWVHSTLADHNVRAVIGYSSPMAQYVAHDLSVDLKKIMDFVDIDSAKWRQYADISGWPMSWVYSREARLLSRFEQLIAENFDAAVFVSDQELEHFSRHHPTLDDKLFAARNGVNTDYFDPALNFQSPFSSGAKAIVFTGVMDYWPNVDAMQWFAESLFPTIKRLVPQAELWIVGASPTKAVIRLSQSDGVQVTGRVEDVRPYLKHAALVTAPLRIAQGVQNKVLEALAMGKNVICTREAASGLHDLAAAPLTIADSESALLELVSRNLLNTCGSRVRRKARSYVLKNYSWDQNLQVFDRLIRPENVS